MKLNEIFSKNKNKQDYKSLRDKIINIISERTSEKKENLTDNRYLGDLGMDSLDKMELIFTLEKEFNINIDDSYQEFEINGDMTIGEIIQMVEIISKTSKNKKLTKIKFSRSL